MENKKVELMAGMESKLAELEKALADVRAKHEEIVSAKASGEKAVADMLQKRAEIKEAMQMATDLGEAKLMLAQMDELEKDAQLQMTVNNGVANKLKGELAELFNTFFVIHASAKHMFKGLDKAYVLDMSINNAEETVKAMEDVANKINFSFDTAKRLLIVAGLVEQKDNFYQARTMRVHLTGYPLVTKGNELKREMLKLKRHYSLDV